jgi:anti-sigma-K factor RskA/putative zinc finger protein
MTCDEARDQAAGFVLGALTPAEERAVREHLATCAEAHDEFAELGGVVPALATSVEQVEPPPALRERIMAAAAVDLRGHAPATVPSVAPPVLARPAPAPVIDRPRSITTRTRATRFGWALGIAAVLAFAALGVWNVRLQGQLTDAQAYQQRVEEVLTIARTPGSVMAVLAPASAGGQDGLIAIASNGDAAMVVKGLPAASANEVYEVWVIVGTNAPIPAGALSQSGGLAFMTGKPGPVPVGATVALTQEPGPNPTAPTSPILVKGVVGPSA